MNYETQWVEENCTCGISEKTNEWSEHVFDLFGCNCKPDEEAEFLGGLTSTDLKIVAPTKEG